MATANYRPKIKLPDQYEIRAITLDDAEAVTSLISQVNQVKGYKSIEDVDELRSDWQEPNFNLEESSLIIKDENAVPIAFAILWDNSETPVRPWISVILKDELYGTDVEAYLFDWISHTAERVIEKCPPDARIALGTSALEGYDRRIKSLKNAGFTHSRNFYRMTIEMDEAPAQKALPANIEIRGMRYPEELEAMTIAVEEGFRDHWGFVEEPIEEALKSWKHYIENDKLFDPDLYFLAIDTKTNEIAGVALCRIEQFGKPETAYVEEFAVLPKYRRQGLGLAMLLHAFGEFYKRGRKQVALHVDADSLTGATRVYAKAGMKSAENWMRFEKVIRDGVEISTTSLD